MKHKRLILGSILLLLLFSLMLYYSLDRNTHDPNTYYILTHYEEYIHHERTIGWCSAKR